MSWGAERGGAARLSVVVVRKPAWPRRSPALLVCVLIQKGGTKRRSGRFHYYRELCFVKSGPAIGCAAFTAQAGKAARLAAKGRFLRP